MTRVAATGHVSGVGRVRSAVVVRPAAVPAGGSSVGPSLLAAGLVVTSVILRLAYIASDCPLDLAPDEAHYWDWSRRPDWGYYSKGPVVAWLIGASCFLFGNTLFAVRLPAVACHALLLWAVYVLARRTLGSGRSAVAAVALALTLPPVAAGAVLTTIDAPFLACWAWALVFAHRAVTTGRGWLAAGAVTAVGVLAKYTMLAFPACVGLYLVADRGRRHLLAGRGFWALAAVGGLGLVPVVGWNAAHGWVGVRHVFTQAGVVPGAKDTGFRWFGPAEFAAAQAGMLVGVWFVAWVGAAWAFRPRGAADGRAEPGRSPGRCRDLAFLWWTSVPVALFFLLVSLRAKTQANWPAAGYLSGLVLVVAWVRGQLADPVAGRRWRWGVGGGVTAGLIVSAVGYFPGLLSPVFAAAAGAATRDHSVPLRKLDPTARLRGWRYLAAAVDDVRDRVRAADGAEPVLAGLVWNVPGELAFYCRGNPEAYCLAVGIGERYSQYDLWRPNPVADAQAFRGRTFLVVADPLADVSDAFDRVDPPVCVEYADGGTLVARWAVFVCRGYTGFDNPRRRGTVAKY